MIWVDRLITMLVAWGTILVLCNPYLERRWLRNAAAGLLVAASLVFVGRDWLI